MYKPPLHFVLRLRLQRAGGGDVFAEYYSSCILTATMPSRLSVWVPGTRVLESSVYILPGIKHPPRSENTPGKDIKGHT